MMCAESDVRDVAKTVTNEGKYLLNKAAISLPCKHLTVTDK